jgi:hypothetical protein
LPDIAFPAILARDGGWVYGLSMIELIRTNDLVLISLVEAILAGERISYVLADQHMSVVEGSTGFLPRRILVAENEATRARRVLREAGLAGELERE